MPFPQWKSHVYELEETLLQVKFLHLKTSYEEIETPSVKIPTKAIRTVPR